jgi:hypothetical protein
VQTKLAKSIIGILIFLTGSFTSRSAQVFGFAKDFVFLDTNNGTLELALTGGIRPPRVSMAEINNDGFKYPYILDRTGIKPIALIFHTDKENFRTPEYELVSPAIQDRVMFYDYNDDCRADLSDRNEYNCSIDLLRNVISSKDLFIRFKKVNDSIISYNFFDLQLDSNRVFCVKDKVSAILAIDNEEDFNFLSFQTNGSDISYSLNYTKPNKESLHPHSFEEANEYRGHLSGCTRFNEFLPQRCKFCRWPHYSNQKHSGRSPHLLFDAGGQMQSIKINRY